MRSIMTETGIVKSIEGDNIQLELKRNSACSSCSSCEIKGGCNNSVFLVEQKTDVLVTVKNTIRANVGDTVMISADSGNLVGMTAGVFVLPVLIALAIYSIANLFFGQLTTYLITFAAWIISFVLIAKVLNRYTKNHFKITAVKIIEKGSEESVTADDNE